ncbi:MAG: response regulator [Chitinispirillales bacterium]|jgi:two-component system chemotaxis response regulator CheY|nr:response regulator [Chitinispirillales bacterium]
MAYNILIVDDSQTMRAVLTKTIDMAGIEVGKVFEAENGKEALGVLEKEWVDIVFADINMPVMNGVEMVEEMVKLGYIETTPVIVISTEGSKTRLDSLRSMGVRGFLRKPVSPELFKSVVDGVLSGRAGGEGGAPAGGAAEGSGESGDVFKI